jgi:hypothetical protein
MALILAILMSFIAADEKPVKPHRPKQVTAPKVEVDPQSFYALPGGGFIYK